MRVSIVTETYPPEINGVAMTLHRLAGGLAARGHAVQVIHPMRADRTSEVAQAGVEEVNVRGCPIPHYPEMRVGRARAGELRGIWQRFGPEVVHVATEGPLGWMAARCAARDGVPLVTSFHTNFHQYAAHYRVSFLGGAVLRHLRAVHNRGRLTLVPDPGLVEELRGAGFLHPSFFGRGVDGALFDPARRHAELRRAWGVTDDTPVLVHVSRLAREKNLPLLFEIFEELRHEEPKMRLVVVGDGPEMGFWRRHLPPGVILTGSRMGPELGTIVASADWFIFPSLTETYGNVVAEAMAAGLVTVAYDYAAARQLIRHGENGFVAQIGEPGSLLKVAREALGRRREWHTLGAAARATALQRPWSALLDQYLRDIEGVIPQESKEVPG